jgi:hypothetical protein
VTQALSTAEGERHEVAQAVGKTKGLAKNVRGGLVFLPPLSTQ